jgi:hypothetical protein
MIAAAAIRLTAAAVTNIFSLLLFMDCVPIPQRLRPLRLSILRCTRFGLGLDLLMRPGAASSRSRPLTH